jgi:tetratricopeptide (TPR) repeat protein
MSTNLDFGEALRRRRVAGGMSLGALAARTHYDKGYLSKVERGLRKPSMEFVRHCDVALKADGALTRLAEPAARPRIAAPRAPGDDASAALGWPAWAEHPAAPAVGDRAGFDPARPEAAEAKAAEAGEADALVVYRSLFTELRRLGRREAPERVLPNLRTLIDVLRSAYLAEDRRRLEYALLAAHCAELAGWMSQEAGRYDEAVSWTTVAGRLAEGTDLSAYAWVRLAEIAVRRNDVAGALRAAGYATEQAPAAPRVQAIAAHNRAYAHAIAGDVRDCGTALAQAAELLAQDVAAPRDGFALGSTTLTDLGGLAAGWCHGILGDHDRAIESLERALGTLPASSRRMRGLCTARLGAAYAACGQIDAACTAGREALTQLRYTRSEATYTQLRGLAKYLLRCRKHTGAQDLYVDMTAALYGFAGAPSGSSRF